MQMREYLIKYNSLASEDDLFHIPFRKEYVLNRIGRGKKVLDVGCLGGRVSQLILEQNNEVWGIEVNPAAAAVAERRGVRVKIANIEDGLPFENASFDFVNAGEVVEHLYDTKWFFHEAWRVLRKGGMLLFTTPNLNSFENRIRVVTGGYLTMAGAYPEDHFGEHVRVFNVSKIQELCGQTDFDIIDICGVAHLKSHGKLIDIPLGWLGKAFPTLAKMLMVTAKKV